MLGVFLDKRVLPFILPVLCFILLYSKLPHKELRFIISSVPMFNLSAAIAANRIYNNKKKTFWKLLYLIMLGLLLIRMHRHNILGIIWELSKWLCIERVASDWLSIQLWWTVGSYWHIFSHEWNFTLLWKWFSMEVFQGRRHSIEWTSPEKLYLSC